MSKTYTYSCEENAKMGIAEMLAAYNSKRNTMSTKAVLDLRADIDTKVEQLNDVAKQAQIAKWLAMDRATMFTNYCQNPTAAGCLKVAEDAKTHDLTKTMFADRVKFSLLERSYQLSQSKESDEQGQPLPNRTATLCSDGRWSALLGLFIMNLDKASCADINARQPKLTETVTEALKKNEFEMFLKNSKDTRIEQLKTIVKAILPAELQVSMLSCDLKYLALAEVKAKNGIVKGSSEKQFIDEIIVAIGHRMAGKAYDFQSKAKIYEKQTKA